VQTCSGNLFHYLSTDHGTLVAIDISIRHLTISSWHWDSPSVGSKIYSCKTFVLPRSTHSVREVNAKLATNSDGGTAMTTMDFQERVQESTGGDVYVVGERLQVIKTCQVFCRVNMYCSIEQWYLFTFGIRLERGSRQSISISCYPAMKLGTDLHTHGRS
jgi:hypothetical protein